jgi:hypothetical protein
VRCAVRRPRKLICDIPASAICGIMYAMFRTQPPLPEREASAYGMQDIKAHLGLPTGIEAMAGLPTRPFLYLALREPPPLAWSTAGLSPLSPFSFRGRDTGSRSLTDKGKCTVMALDKAVA